MLICPVCKNNINKSENSYICKNNHSFDLSKNGYLNLLTSKGRNPKLAGDNADMVKSRSDFLDKGYYQPLADKISDILAEDFKNRKIDKPIIVDSGCGEGFYNINICKNIVNSFVYGLDISKIAISHASKRAKAKNVGNAFFSVASSFELPFKKGCADAIISIFAPVSNDEYSRVLKKNGKLFIVSPNSDHLFGLKKVLYENPYKNRPNDYQLSSFKLIKQHNFQFEITLKNNEDIMSLFVMTPYFYRTSLSDKEKLNSLESLKTLCDFSIFEYVAT